MGDSVLGKLGRSACLRVPGVRGIQAGEKALAQSPRSLLRPDIIFCLSIDILDQLARQLRVNVRSLSLFATDAPKEARAAMFPTCTIQPVASLHEANQHALWHE